ncbi:histidine phosphatase family protein [Streptomyces sp. NPDC049585]|uniref:histidine phosphatase family protein n=1 Tax=Streptomyces sp. NPDC049585 TaxID=3155154 RepID=UPI0034334B97
MRDTPLVPRCRLGELTVIRHGQSTANAVFAAAGEDGRAPRALREAGDAAVPLSPLGALQAERCGTLLAGRVPGPDLVLCSPYRRAQETWQIMAAEVARLGRGLPPVLVDERVRDRETGVLELLTPADVRAEAPEEARRRARTGEWCYRPPGGESLADVALRVRDLLAELGAAVPGAHVLVVGHDGIAVTARHVLAGIGSPADLQRVGNASVSSWEGDGRRLRLVTFGATNHLDGLPVA